MSFTEEDFAIKYISFDPGDKRTGVVCWNHKGNPLCTKILTLEELDKFLEEFFQRSIKTFIIEDYKVRPWVPHNFSRVDVIKVIGQLEAFARKYNIEIVLQPSTILKIAAMWSQTKLPKGHLPDNVSAYLHGYYYLHKNGVIKAKVLENEESKDG